MYNSVGFSIFRVVQILSLYNFRRFSSSQKKLHINSYSPFLSSSPWKPLTCFLPLWVFLFWTLYIKCITQTWPLASAFLHLACFQSSLMLQYVSLLHVFQWLNFIVWINYILFIYSSVDWHFSCFHCGVIMNNSLNIHVQIFLETCFHFSSISLGVESALMVTVYFEEPPNCFQSHCIILNPHQLCMRPNVFIFFSALITHLFILLILVGVKRFSVHIQVSFFVLQKYLIQLLYIVSDNTNI